jgi:hypothetical protein
VLQLLGGPSQPAPIDNTRSGLLASNYPSSRSCAMNWSKVDVFRAVPAHLRRVLVFLVTAVSCLLVSAGDGWAAGCHVTERPVLASKLSWENELAVDFSVAPPVLAPPVLIHPPCHGEVPQWLGSTDRPSAARWHHWIGIDSPSQSGSVTAGSPAEHPQPPSSRLDRPPRLIKCWAMIGLPD